MIRISINHGEGEGLISVEEFYNKALSGDRIELTGYSDFSEFTLDSIGNSNGYYGDYQNAVEFESGEIVAEYTIGGI